MIFFLPSLHVSESRCEAQNSNSVLGTFFPQSTQKRQGRSTDQTLNLGVAFSGCIMRPQGFTLTPQHLSRVSPVKVFRGTQI